MKSLLERETKKNNAVLKFIFSEENSSENRSYIADVVLSKGFLSFKFGKLTLLEIFGYEEARKFCDNFELELVSDKLDFISAPYARARARTRTRRFF